MKRFLYPALLAGLLTGSGEVGILALRHFGLHRLVFAPPEVIWMAPLSAGVLFLGAGLLLALVARVTGGRLTPAIASGVFAGLSVFTLCLNYGPLSRIAAFVLALGVAIQAARYAAAHADGVAHWSRRLVIPLGGLIMLAGIGLYGYRRVEGSRQAGTAPSQAPNVLLIILDTVRALDLSLYGYHRPTTPELERFAADGVRFARVISPAPWTLPAHASIFTGRWPHELSAGWTRALDGQQPTLAEVLSARGFASAGFVANTHYAGRESGIGRGFGWYRDYPITPAQVLFSSALGRFVVHSRYLESRLTRVHAEDINGEFLGWLDERRPAQPFFAFLNYMDAHDPYQPPAPFAGRFGRPGDAERLLALEADMPARKWPPDIVQAAIGAYDESIAALDARLGELFRELERRGELDQTLIIVTADHGEEFGEHGVFSHGNSLYRPSLEVPLVVRWPGHVPAGVVLPGPVSTRDLAATILDLAGIEGHPIPGRSLARFWNGSDTLSAAEPLLSEVGWAPQLPKNTPVSRGAMRSIVHEGAHLIRNGDGRYELFDFDRDAAERTDLAGDTSRVPWLGRLRGALDSIRPVQAQ
jgi:arylsulfatase A-like enzyme